MELISIFDYTGAYLMKICILPGVGYQSSEPDYPLIQALKENNTVVYFDWSNKRLLHLYLIKPFLSNYVREILLDFQQAILHGNTITLPEADLYIGHSAGGLIAATTNKPAIFLGTPFHMVMQVGTSDVNSLISKPFRRLNIVNIYDIFSEGTVGLTNMEYKSSLLSKYLPWLAHVDYWNNSKVITTILDFIKELKGE